MKRNNNVLYKSFAIAFLVLYTILTSYAQERTKSFSDLFDSNEILNIRLESDFKKVFKNRDDTTNYDAVLSYFDENGTNERISLKIRSRGVQRKIECSFKPLKLNFEKKSVISTIFENQQAIKLVTHCRKQNVYEQNTIQEYLIYRALNILTDTSFRVRPLQINYVYNGKRIDSIQRFGFIIERFKYMAERLEMKTFKKMNFHPKRTDIDHMNLIDLFQFMIGNTDYSVYKLHNVKLIIDTIVHQKPLAVPFDFDWCGLIDAAYAKPNPMFGTKSVGERIYRGFELDASKLQKIFDRFNLKRTDIVKLFENEPLLNKSEKRRVSRYLKEFYNIINKPDAVNDFIKVSRSLEI